MIAEKEFFIPSCDGKTMLRAMEWVPNNPRAVVQIVHGVAEHIERYACFARFLAGNGYYVAGCDILGHGKSVSSPDDIGYFAENDGWLVNVEDIHALRLAVQDKYQSLPYFILGHSMGSFLTRTYITKYADGLAGVLISGTGYNPEAVLTVGRLIAASVIKMNGKRAKSELIRRLCFGSYNNKIKNPPNENAWLSRDKAVSEAYNADPLCGFLPSVALYYEMFRGISYIQKNENIRKIPIDLPVLFFSGTADPVGAYSKGVIKVYESYKKAGVTDVSIKLYDGGRHEMLNETNKGEVYSDVLGWLDNKVKEIAPCCTL